MTENVKKLRNGKHFSRFHNNVVGETLAVAIFFHDFSELPVMPFVPLETKPED